MKKIRRIILFFIIALVLSGITAFPIVSELDILSSLLPDRSDNNTVQWIRTVHTGYTSAYEIAPFIAYGTDWLAFAHIVIATAFIGPYRDPVRNKWVIEFGMIACVMVFPLALIAGNIRGIPVVWQIVDCSFGVIGFLVLYYCNTLIKKLEKSQTHSL